MDQDRIMDAIGEIVNIGIGDAAAAFSELIDSPIQIQAPDIRLLDTSEIPEYFKDEIKSLGVFISQNFEGVIEGKTILFYTRQSSMSLLNLLYPDTFSPSSLSESGKSVLQEIGNIILVSCVSTISNVLEGRFVFKMPQVTEESSQGVFLNLVASLSSYEKAIVVKNTIRVKGKAIDGYIFILLGFKGFKTMVEKIMKEKMQ